MFWSPRGDFIILAGLKNLNGYLEFFNVNDMESICTEEHATCTNVDWDPSGRYVATSVSHWRHQLDTGYNMYTFSGKLVYKVLKEKFCQLLWRPRPPTLLTPEQIKHIKGNYDKYKDIFEKQDDDIRGRIDIEKKRQRDAIRREFYKLAEDREREYAAWRVRLNDLYGRDLEAEEKNVEEVEETVEELIGETEEIIDD